VKTLLSLDEMKSFVDAAKAAGQRVVFTNGCFDVLHGGHIENLEACRSAGDVLVMAINSDASVRALKGPYRPVVNENERAEVLQALAAVDAVMVFDEPTVDSILEALLPHVHAKGPDYTPENLPERDTDNRLGIEIHIAGPPKQNNTSAIVG